MIQNQSYCFRGLVTISFFFFLHSLPNTFASPAQSLCRPDQRDALLELQKEFPNHTNDDEPVTTVSWNKSIDCCSWLGVTCDDILGEVISLELKSYSSVNTSLKSSSSLFKLHHLRELDLSDCRLHGEIPSSIGNLSHLTYLDLSSNYFIGEIPHSIGNLNQLRYLTLLDNGLRGKIPTSMANLTKLSDLYLKSNQFTCGDMRILANLTSLSEIDLSFNHFKSSLSVDLSGLHNLERFIVDYNSFFGPFPSSLLMISSLGLISLAGNQFEGPLDFGNMSSPSNFGLLDVSYKKFGGLIPTSISKLHSLAVLDLSYNNFKGHVPISISSLVNLYSLDLSYNKLEGPIPSLLWRSSILSSVELSHNLFSSFANSVDVVDGASLSELNLGSNLLGGSFPQWICKLKNLWALDMSHNHFTGSIPHCLNSTSLSELKLRNNNLSGVLPDIFTNLTNLKSLDVSHNNFVGKLPRSLIHCKNTRLLNVEENKINDTFPFWLGSSEFFEIFVLRSNAFHGPVYNPITYLGFPSLRIINIANNDFVGSLPQDYFANWTQMSIVWSNEDSPEYEYMGDDSDLYVDSIDLMYKGVETYFPLIFQAFKVIDFSGNRFSGHIPESIGLLSELLFLNLSGNSFKGNIPPSLSNVTKLETLDLSRNNLSGEIPQGLGKLSFLSYINFSHNHLQGWVPQSTQFQSQDCSSFMGNSGLHGLEKMCKENHVNVPFLTSQPPDESLSDLKEPVLNWIAAAIAYGPGLFCGLVLGHIFTSYKHEWFIDR